MGPHFSTLAEPSPCLIYDKCNTKLFCQAAQSFVEKGRSLSVLISSDGLNNYGCDVFVLRLGLFDKLFGLSKAASLFFAVLLFELRKRVLKLW